MFISVGDFEYIEAFTNRKYNGKELPVRVYTTRGLKEQGNWALQHAPKIIDFFSEAFDIDYPLPKSDILAGKSPKAIVSVVIVRNHTKP